jgi:hypothetical protein
VERELAGIATVNSISLVISLQGVECVRGRLDPDMDARLTAYRLVHEQLSRERDVRWFFFAKTDLTKPEALSRAQQWYASTHYTSWPGIAY